ncbi:hypothetical protein [Sphingomonas xinjiangensis]|uniref:DUF3052 domain-containing protein n=1 Tax=Sphingomonas xinjiangensis TaxID=643568 RepID=A0A840YBD0_9SPHN|nr:hypothetical protein [Sphingomonas xinjiangensis]MBB5709595.1 hypothetical protein [Sphingomonas xinjiangensis]
MAADHILAEQLGLKPGIRCWFHNLPEALRARIDADALGIEEQPTATDGLQCAVLCASDSDALRRELTALAPLMATKGIVWILLPVSGGTAELERMDHLAAPVNLVIADTCGFDENWSGTKLIGR